MQGLIDILANLAIEITDGDPWSTFILVIWFSGIASAFVDNIPLTTTMIPMIHTLNADPTIAASFGPESGFQFSPLWWALALGADFGGNGTLIGSSAGVVAVGLSEKFGHHISFSRWIQNRFSIHANNFGNRNSSTLWISYANTLERELF